MGFNEFLSSIFGNKSTRDMKEIKPWVEKIKAAYPEIEKLDNDALRAKTEELKKYIHESATAERAKVEELKASIETLELEDREEVFAQIDKTEKEILEKYEKALDEVLPVAFSIVKATAKRFTENEEIVVTATDFDRQLAATKDFVRIEGDKAIYQNHWVAGGNDTLWNMVHYDVQLFGGVVLHKGKIAEMATGEGKTLVATLPVFLNALTGNGVHVVTVNDYLAKRDSEWMGPLYMFHGLSVDCIDRHQPNSDARRQAYLADITFGTNNEFGFDYLRDNMAISPKDLVQRQHNYAIVDEVDSVLIDDARTPLIISGPVPKGDDQLFEQLRPLVERLVEAQKVLATKYLSEAKKLIASNDKKEVEEGFLALYRSHKALPKNKALIKFLSEQGIKAGMLKTEEIYMEQNNKRMHEVTDPLYFVIDEKLNSVDLTDKGVDLITGNSEDPTLFVLPDIAGQLSELENLNLTNEQLLEKKDELLTNSITPIQQFSYTQGKNSTDSAMIIDAMDILYTNDVDGFCIVSSDSDFTRLVSRLRESGKMVIGMGENKTPEPFRKACDKFTILENLMSEQNPGTTKNETSHDKRSKEKIEDAIIKMIIENQDINKPTGLGEVGSRLVSLYPDFDVRSYGYNMLSKFLEEFTRIQMVKHGNIVSVTLREDQDLKENIDSYVVQIVKKAGKAGVELSTLGNKMYEKYKDFKIRDYGYSQFNQYVKSLKHVRVEQEGTILKAVYKG